MKVAPILAQLREREGVRQVLVHTGQHYDAKMSDVFFQDLGMPEPDVHLGAGSGSHAQQTAKVMVEIEPVLLREKPEVVALAGDVISTRAQPCTGPRTSTSRRRSRGCSRRWPEWRRCCRWSSPSTRARVRACSRSLRRG